jgi:DNA-binding NarL/FixJ family response regulator
VKESYQLSDQETGGDRMTARILIVDDHEIVREGIRTLISRSRPEWVICGEASDGERAIEAVKTLKPDAVILDITMPGMSGLRVSSQIAKLGLGCRVLIFTMHESERLSAEVRKAGAQGHVLKSQAARDLIRAIEELLSGGTFFGFCAR